MNTDNTFMTRPSPQQETDAALFAITDPSKAGILNRTTELSKGTREAPIAEPIQGMVAVTMGHLSADASAITRNPAEQRQDWAMGAADGVAQTVPAAV